MSRWEWQRDSGPALFEPEPEVFHEAVKTDRGADQADLDVVLEVHQQLISQIDPKRLAPLPEADARHAVYEAARGILSEKTPSVMGEDRDQVLEAVCDEVLGLGPIEKLVRDPAVSEVMVNAPDLVYWEEGGVIYESKIRFRDADHIMRVVQRIVAPLGRRVDESSPYVDARLPDGSRVNVIIPPIAYKSPAITIRKFLGDRYTTEDLINVGTMSQVVAEFLAKSIEARLNILISGGTGTGKTTLLNALSAYIPMRERILTIEDPAELRLQQKHVIGLEVRPPNLEGRNEVTQRDLVRNALRMRPDRIIVGEVRGAEAFDMMQAMNTGHEGSLTTVHANSPRDALSRIENMILMAGFELPLSAIREQVASALHLVLQISRLSDGTRRITSVSEVTGLEGQTVTMQELFALRRDGVDAEGRIVAELAPTGLRPHHIERFAAHGLELPVSMFARA
jgi:pilus assembly protein CpaF